MPTLAFLLFTVELKDSKNLRKSCIYITINKKNSFFIIFLIPLGQYNNNLILLWNKAIQLSVKYYFC